MKKNNFKFKKEKKFFGLMFFLLVIAFACIFLKSGKNESKLVNFSHLIGAKPVLAAGICEATTGHSCWYVSKTGDDLLNDGSFELPFSTIAKAVSSMSGGDIIYLRTGTYYEHDITIPAEKSGTNNAWSVLKSYPGEWAKIDGQRASVGSNVYAVIRNNDGNACSGSSFANYWKFERLEITGGGTNYEISDPDGKECAGIWWVKGPFQLNYSFIHNNLCSDARENPSGVGGTAWQKVSIKHNYFDHNGSELHGENGDLGGTNDTTGIMAMSCSEYYPYDVDWEVRDNEFAYNYIMGYGVASGIRTKGLTTLTATRNGSDTSRRTHGDKIHHNVIESGLGIFYQQDGVQIYNNIINQSINPNTGANGNEQWSIATRRIRTAGVDTLWPVIYNNTVVNGRDAIADMHDGTSGAYWWVYNNILDSMSSLLYAPITFGCSSDWCGYTSGALNDANVHIDRNYSYRNSNSNAVYIGNEAWPTGAYTLAQWEAYKSGTNLFEQADQESGSNKLYSEQYITIGSHNLGEIGRTISNSGIGGNHPYLSNVTIPSYVGATDPSNNSWVSEVMGMIDTSILREDALNLTDTNPPAEPVGLQVN